MVFVRKKTAIVQNGRTSSILKNNRSTPNNNFKNLTKMPHLKTRTGKTTPSSCSCADHLAQMWTLTLRDAPSNQKTRTTHCSLGGVSGDFFFPHWFISRLSNEAPLAKRRENAKGEYHNIWLALDGWSEKML